MMMEKSVKTIKLALDKFGQSIDNDIQNYNNDLNKIMKTFTFLTVSFLPQTVIGSLFGMNMPVPMAEAQTLWPFFSIVAISVFFSVLAFSYFKHVKYI